jgi:hypothetical protein
MKMENIKTLISLSPSRPHLASLQLPPTPRSLSHLRPPKAAHDDLTESVHQAPGRLLDTLPRVAVTPRALRATHRARLELCSVRLRTLVVGADAGDIGGINDD